MIDLNASRIDFSYNNIIYKTSKEEAEEREAIYRELEENNKQAERRSEEFKKILDELNALLEKS